MIKAVFFDAGNTLLKPHPSMEEVCMEVLGERGFRVDGESLRKALIEAERYYEERYWEDDTFWASEAGSEKMWTELYTLLVGNLGIGEARALGKALYEEFGKASRWALFPDVLPAMRELSRMGVLMGIISNWDVRLATLCHELELSPFLHFVISSASVGRIKPEPAIFRMALERAGVEAGEAVHVGDHYYADVLGARSMGLTPILLDRRGGGSSLDCLVIHSLEELPPIVKMAIMRAGNGETEGLL